MVTGKVSKNQGFRLRVKSFRVQGSGSFEFTVKTMGAMVHG
jgi:hypothetical protein